MKKAYFHNFVEQSRNKGLIIQPRMGFSDPNQMRTGLEEVSSLNFPTIGTITVDSFTRQGLYDKAKASLDASEKLNGYPIVVYTPEQNRSLLDGLQKDDFPIQVRHGSPLLLDIFRAIINADVDATEGGPISYCLHLVK